MHQRFSYLSFFFMLFNLIILPSYLFVDSRLHFHGLACILSHTPCIYFPG